MAVEHPEAGGRASPQVLEAFDTEQLRLIALAAALMPIAGRRYAGKKGRPTSAVQHVMWNSLKVRCRCTPEETLVLTSPVCVLRCPTRIRTPWSGSTPECWDCFGC